MIPQNAYDSPHRRQRFIEFHNVGAATIPGYAVVEVVESSRPEKGGTVTPNGGRTVIHCRLATTDDPCVTAIVGPCEIPPNGWSRPGTFDDPMLALVDGEYTNGTDVGIVAGSFLLTAGHCGYRIVGDYDATTQTQRVIRSDECQDDSMIVRATECIKPGIGGTAQPQQWNSDTDCWEDAPGSEINVSDPMGWVLALEGDCFKVDRDSRCGGTASGIYTPSFPFGLKRLVIIKQLIDCGECGEVTIMERGSGGSGSGSVTDRCGMTESDCTIDACNVSYRKLGCDANEYAMIEVIPGPCCPTYGSGSGSGSIECMAIITPFPRATRASATLTGPLCGTPAGMAGIEYLDTCDWPHREEPEVAYIEIPRYGCIGKKVELIWNDPDCKWDVLTTEPVAVKPMLDLKCPTDPCDPMETQKPLSDMYAEQCDNCGETDWVPTQVIGERIDVIVGIELGEAGTAGVQALGGVNCAQSGCGLAFTTSNMRSNMLALKKKSVCVYCADATDLADEQGPEVLTGATAGEGFTLPGAMIDIPNGIEVTCDSGSGSGGSGEAGDSTGKAVMTTKRYCLIACGMDNVADGEDIGLDIATVEVTDDVVLYQDGLCIGARTSNITLCVLGADVTNPSQFERELCGTDCDPGSGSGSASGS